MNAPFRMGQQTREAFAAYVCDDDSVEVLKPVASMTKDATGATLRDAARKAIGRRSWGKLVWHIW